MGVELQSVKKRAPATSNGQVPSDLGGCPQRSMGVRWSRSRAVIGLGHGKIPLYAEQIRQLRKAASELGYIQSNGR